MPNVFGKKVDLHPRKGAVRQHVALVLAVERPIIRCPRHRCQHGGIDVVRKDPLELKMIERRFDGAGSIDRPHHEVAQALNRASAIRALEFNTLVHYLPRVSSVV
jgi:hypothetical protein